MPGPVDNHLLTMVPRKPRQTSSHRDPRTRPPDAQVYCLRRQRRRKAGGVGADAHWACGGQVQGVYQYEVAGRTYCIAALVAEVDQALVALQTARKTIADLQRSSQALSRAASREDHAAPASVPASLRYSGMTVAEAADVLELGEEQVRRLLRTGALIGVQFGGRVGWRLSREYVYDVAEQWEAQRRGQAVARRAGVPPRSRR